MMSGSGRLALSSRLSSLSQKMSRLAIEYAALSGSLRNLCRERSVCAWRTWPQITHQAATTNCKTQEGIFQGDERCDSERHKVAMEQYRMFRRTFEARSARGSISSQINKM